VHADAGTLVGGIRALLVQAMHPTVLAGFDQHSGYRSDPETRLQRTAAFVTVTTFGTSAQAAEACERVRRAHRPVRGTTPDGQRYDASDPELLGWVHLALIDSMEVAVSRYGRTTFDPDAYWAETAVVGEHLGAARVPRSGPERDAAFAAYRPALARTDATTAAHRFLLDPPLSPAMRPAYWVLASAAAATLPPDLAGLLGARPLLPAPPARRVGAAATRVLALLLGDSPAANAAARRAAAAQALTDPRPASAVRPGPVPSSRTAGAVPSSPTSRDRENSRGQSAKNSSRS
jgi:uncharacterized protein (DUF2236 family)